MPGSVNTAANTPDTAKASGYSGRFSFPLGDNPFRHPVGEDDAVQMVQLVAEALG